MDKSGASKKVAKFVVKGDFDIKFIGHFRRGTVINRDWIRYIRSNGE